MLGELGCDLERDVLDVPRMRSSTRRRIRSGLMTAFTGHLHRDTWIGAECSSSTGGCPSTGSPPTTRWRSIPATSPRRCPTIRAATTTTSGTRSTAASTWPSWVKEDPRPLPRPTGPVELDPQVRLIRPVGGVIVSRGAQLHSSVPNTSGVTRFSIDFRTVNLDDAIAGRGAKNVDSECTGTTMRDYLPRHRPGPAPRRRGPPLRRRDQRGGQAGVYRNATETAG